MTPDQIARVTDWQALNVYVKPALERAERMRSDMPGGTGHGPTPPPMPDPKDEEIDPEVVAQWAKFIFGGVRRIPKGS